MDFSGFEKMSLVDFDNRVSATLFTAGCDLRCPFCHNGELVLNPARAPKIPWAEIMDYLSKRRGILDAVVITGGEPTLMSNLIDKLRDIKSLGYLVKLDTNGNRPEKIKEFYKEGLIDYVAVDIKNSEAKYALTCGLKSMDLGRIKDTIAFLVNEFPDYEFRTTAMEEFHQEEDFEDIARLIKGAKRYFIQHYKDREGCIEHGFHPLSTEKAERCKTIMEKAGIPTGLRGFEL